MAGVAVLAIVYTHLTTSVVRNVRRMLLFHSCYFSYLGWLENSSDTNGSRACLHAGAGPSIEKFITPARGAVLIAFSAGLTVISARLAFAFRV
jgi:hypothetical protein